MDQDQASKPTGLQAYRPSRGTHLEDEALIWLVAIPQAEELAKSKLEKPKRLQQQAHRDWQEIKHGSLKFQRRQQEAAAIRSLHKSDLVAFFKVSTRNYMFQCLHVVVCGGMSQTITTNYHKVYTQSICILECLVVWFH